MNITTAQITKQFNAIIKRGWLPYFQTWASIAGSTVAHDLAFGSRETNLENIRGDFREGKFHGFGVNQVDVDTDPAYCRQWKPENVEHGITRGAEIYAGKVADTRACVGKTVKVRSKSFTGAPVEPDDLRRVATAAYNCGRWAHYHLSKGENVDSTTTGHDYSRDVYDRAIYFAALLEGREIVVDAKGNLSFSKKTRTVYVVNALANEILLQGKFARDVHKVLANLNLSERVKLAPGEAQESQDALAQANYERRSLVSVSTAITPASILPDTTASDPTENNSTAADQTENDQLASGASPSSNIPTEKSELKIETGDASFSASTTEPTGDAPDAPARGFIKLQDWKPFVTAWLARTWKTCGGLNITQFTTISGFGLTYGGQYWWAYVAAALLLGLFFIVVALIASIALGWIWYTNRKEIFHAHTLVAEAKKDPKAFNLGIEFDTKTASSIKDWIFGKAPLLNGIIGN